jgi:hypothetical protein
MNNTNIVEECKKRGIEGVKFYAGWLFVAGFKSYPLHHAWTVYQDNVIDVSVRPKDLELFEYIENNPIPNWREKYARKFVDLFNQAKQDMANSCLMGDIFNDKYIYVGCEDDPWNARKIYNDLIDMYPNHPAYSHKGSNPNGASALQQEMMKYL